MPRTAVLRSAQAGPGASPGRPTPAQRSSMPPPRAIVRATPHAPVQCPGHLDGSAQSWYLSGSTTSTSTKGRIYHKTYGCQMNISDMEIVLSIMKNEAIRVCHLYMTFGCKWIMIIVE
ncbi:uncharacterized protein LOC100381343 [Zea mays]|uniref:MTTase N-terminal domain-containing protein n=1 Tax=Zea mays TaxID=4577 RepID=B6TEI3_MAIZE|nr:uncharacterized protein LOC100381343 [Zea mays]ACG35516.1 hypothetical protein [Zea mays]|eukprot:NP_001167682.1 uncharacterized protein LOC100381343 [Zea mays]